MDLRLMCIWLYAVITICLSITSAFAMLGALAWQVNRNPNKKKFFGSERGDRTGSFLISPGSLSLHGSPLCPSFLFPPWSFSVYRLSFAFTTRHLRLPSVKSAASNARNGKSSSYVIVQSLSLAAVAVCDLH